MQPYFRSALVLVPGLRFLCGVCLVADEVVDVVMQYALHLGICQLLCSMLWSLVRGARRPSPCRYVCPLLDILAGIAGFCPRSVIETVWIVEENRSEYFIDVEKCFRLDYFTCLEDDLLDQCLCLGAL